MNKPATPLRQSPMDGLVGYITTALARPLPPEVIAKTKQHVLDTLAAMLSGSRLEPGEAAIGFFEDQGGTAQAHIAGSPLVTSAINAAWANGILAHADETDDNHIPGLTHPGCSIVPTALAVGEKLDASGRDLLAAVTLGYDVATRCSQSLQTNLFAEGRYIHAISGSFGSAAAAAALLQLDKRQVRSLFSYMAQQASGIWAWKQGHDHIEKAFVVGGMPARNAVSAALMVKAGFTGIEDVFSGIGNFYDSCAPQGNPMALLRELGSHYEIMRGNIKKWCVGGPVQAPLDGLIQLVKDGLTAKTLADLEIRIATRDAGIVDNTDISTIGIQHLVALALVAGKINFASAHDLSRVTDPEILAVRAKIRLVADGELQKLLPVRHAILNAKLTDGSVKTVHIEGARGTFGNPMSQGEVDEKAIDLIAPVLGATSARKIVDYIATLDRAGSARELGAMLASDRA